MIALLLTVFLQVHALAAPKTVVTIGFNPTENSDSLEANGKQFAAYYKKHTGIEARTFVASDYTALIEAMRAGRVDFAFLPPFSLVKAEQLADAKVLLKAVRHGRDVFYAGLITRADKGYEKIEDLKGKTIAWVDPASTSGFIVPKAALLDKKKLNLDSYFAKQVFAGSHDAVVLAVLNGTVDAGATWVNDTEGKDGAWHLYLKTPAEQKKVRMVFVSDPIPNETMATTAKLARQQPALVSQTVKLLREMGDSPEGRKVLQELYGIDSMVPTKSAEYRPVREAARLLGLQ